MIVTALLGAGAGLGLWLIVRSVTTRPVRLADVSAALDRPGRTVADPDTRTYPAGIERRLGPLALRLTQIVGLDPARRRQDLRLVGRTVERHMVDRLLGAAGGLGTVTLTGLSATIVGIHPPIGALMVLAAAATAAGFVLPDIALSAEVARRRTAFRHAFGAYLDLVNAVLAGGGGIETALWAAAERGDGWAFAELRRALALARNTHRTPWAAFAQLGAELGVAELGELAASVALAGTEGAKIRASLAAKADTLRAHQLSETEAAAESATERMTIPVAVLLFGFLVFIAYPFLERLTAVHSAAPLP